MGGVQRQLSEDPCGMCPGAASDATRELCLGVDPGMKRREMNESDCDHVVGRPARALAGGVAIEPFHKATGGLCGIGFRQKGHGAEGIVFRKRDPPSVSPAASERMGTESTIRWSAVELRGQETKHLA
jgi:hypothetical protein